MFSESEVLEKIKAFENEAGNYYSNHINASYLNKSIRLTIKNKICAQTLLMQTLEQITPEFACVVFKRLNGMQVHEFYNHPDRNYSTDSPAQVNAVLISRAELNASIDRKKSLSKGFQLVGQYFYKQQPHVSFVKHEVKIWKNCDAIDLLPVEQRVPFFMSNLESCLWALYRFTNINGVLPRGSTPSGYGWYPITFCLFEAKTGATYEQMKTIVKCIENTPALKYSYQHQKVDIMTDWKNSPACDDTTRMSLI